MQTEQERLQAKVDKDLSIIVNRRAVTTTISLEDHLSVEQIDKLKKYLLIQFGSYTGVQYGTSHADYLELYTKLFPSVKENKISIHHLNIICRMLDTGTNLNTEDEDEIYDFLLFKVEMGILTQVLENGMIKISDESDTELRSQYQLQMKNPKAEA